jgi:hypothetical protein
MSGYESRLENWVEGLCNSQFTSGQTSRMQQMFSAYRT